MSQALFEPSYTFVDHCQRRGGRDACVGLRNGSLRRDGQSLVKATARVTNITHMGIGYYPRIYRTFTGLFPHVILSTRPPPQLEENLRGYETRLRQTEAEITRVRIGCARIKTIVGISDGRQRYTSTPAHVVSVCNRIICSGRILPASDFNAAKIT